MNTRKHPRLKGYDYSQNGAYFVTFCTKERAEILSRIVGRGILDAPSTELTPTGKCVRDAILYLAEHDRTVTAEHFVIMPNHVHLMVVMEQNGPMRASGPTLGMIVRSIKTQVTRAAGCVIWQDKFYDHIVRNQDDYLQICSYIESNPAKWTEDKYYTAQES